MENNQTKITLFFHIKNTTNDSGIKLCYDNAFKIQECIFERVDDNKNNYRVLIDNTYHDVQILEGSLEGFVKNNQSIKIEIDNQIIYGNKNKFETEQIINVDEKNVNIKWQIQNTDGGSLLTKMENDTLLQESKCYAKNAHFNDDIPEFKILKLEEELQNYYIIKQIITEYKQNETNKKMVFYTKTDLKGNTTEHMSIISYKGNMPLYIDYEILQINKRQYVLEKTRRLYPGNEYKKMYDYYKENENNKGYNKYIFYSPIEDQKLDIKLYNNMLNKDNVRQYTQNENIRKITDDAMQYFLNEIDFEISNFPQLFANAYLVSHVDENNRNKIFTMINTEEEQPKTLRDFQSKFFAGGDEESEFKIGIIRNLGEKVNEGYYRSDHSLAIVIPNPKKYPGEKAYIFDSAFSSKYKIKDGKYIDVDESLQNDVLILNSANIQNGFCCTFYAMHAALEISKLTFNEIKTYYENKLITDDRINRLKAAKKRTTKLDIIPSSLIANNLDYLIADKVYSILPDRLKKFETKYGKGLQQYVFMAAVKNKSLVDEEVIEYIDNIEENDSYLKLCSKIDSKLKEDFDNLKRKIDIAFNTKHEQNVQGSYVEYH